MRDWKRQVVVTGAGVVCNLGDDLEAMKAQIRVGANQPFTTWDLAVDNNARCELIGAYPGDLSDGALGIAKKKARFMGRASRLAIRATRSALAMAGIDDPSDLGVVVGSGTGDVETHEQITARLAKTHDTRKIAPTVIPRIMASTVSANLVNVFETRGPSVSATAACAGGAYNILLAAQLIEHGHTEAAIVGGVEQADFHFHAGFDAMRAYNGEDNATPARASRPYAADRAGFIFGEGSGILVLETLGRAQERGARILGTIRGYGMSSDGAGEMVAPSQDGARRAMLAALRHAELEPSDIGYVNTHGTSTPVGDVSEVNAIRAAFGAHRPVYSSTKGYTGHTISAAGAIEAIFTLAMLEGGWLAPCVNAEPLDPALEDFPPLREPLDLAVDHAMSTSFGFGGTNAALVLSRTPRR